MIVKGQYLLYDFPDRHVLDIPELEAAELKGIFPDYRRIRFFYDDTPPFTVYKMIRTVACEQIRQHGSRFFGKASGVLRHQYGMSGMHFIFTLAIIGIFVLVFSLHFKTSGHRERDISSKPPGKDILLEITGHTLIYAGIHLLDDTGSSIYRHCYPERLPVHRKIGYIKT